MTRDFFVYLYLNEPRTMPLAFFATRPDLQVVPVKDRWELSGAALCTCAPEVRARLTGAAA